MSKNMYVVNFLINIFPVRGLWDYILTSLQIKLEKLIETLNKLVFSLLV